MKKRLLVALGVAMIAVPRAIVDAGERLAFENPDDATLRRTTIPAARAEGLLALAIARRGRWPPALALPIGLVGAAMIVAPGAMLRVGLRLAYRDPDRIRPKPWVAVVARLAGTSHVLLARRILGGRGS